MKGDLDFDSTTFLSFLEKSRSYILKRREYVLVSKMTTQLIKEDAHDVNAQDWVRNFFICMIQC
jgi:hypothetical protein